MILIFKNKRLVLKNPDFDNNYVVPLDTRIDIAMDGTRYSFVNPNENTIQNWTFRGLTREKIIETFQFLQDTISQDIHITDQNDEHWLGKLDNDPITSVHESISSSTLNLRFEGSKIQ